MTPFIITANINICISIYSNSNSAVSQEMVHTIVTVAEGSQLCKPYVRSSKISKSPVTGLYFVLTSVGW